MPSMLITRPDHDDITAYMHAWSFDVLKAAKESGVEVIDLAGKKANKAIIESILMKKEPGFVVLNGHGEDKLVKGYKDMLLIMLGDNDKLLDSRITYSISCDSARKLGRRFHNSKNTTYIGYTGAFSFIMNGRRSATPRKDEVAEPVFDSSNLITLSLIKGRAVNDSVERGKRRIRYWIEILRKSKDPNAPHIIPCLIDNLYNLAVYGDEEAILR
jgi:hypothetical protein